MLTRPATRFLELQALAGLQHLRFTTRRRIDGSYSGRHQSRQLSGSGEFVDFREYSPGDDLRKLDWKVMARTGRRYLRLYQDETDLTCTILIDASSSMKFAVPVAEQKLAGTKLEYVQYFATALTHLLVSRQDRVGLAIASDQLQHFLPPGCTPDHLQRVHRVIDRLSTWPATNLGVAIQELFNRFKRRGVLLVASDFLCDDLAGTFSALRLFRSRFWEVVALHIVHPAEEKLPAGDAFRFVGLENEGTINCTPAEIREAYERRFEEHCATVRSLAQAAGCDYRRVSTAVPYLQTLSGFLAERAG
ncbi:MAG: DUF58 domain-containing protein [Planctomycetes bacterium]|nr:DUF58 domain-containing protein [Planctomycetota bacterium]